MAIDIFKKILKRFKYVEKIPNEVRSLVAGSRKTVLKSTLKRVNNLSLFYSSVITIYFQARRFGLRISIKASKVFTLTVYSVIAGIVVSGALFAAMKLTEKDVSIVKEKVLKKKEITEKESLTENKEIKEKEMPAFDTRLGIVRLTPEGIDKDLAYSFSKSLYSKLSGMRGHARVVFTNRSELKRKSINRQLLGMISKLGKTYVISVRVVNSENGHILYDKTVTCRGEDKINETIDKMASGINGVSKIWKKY